MSASNPRQEALDRLGGRYDVRVLEPSPPAVSSPPWFADDPTARGPLDGVDAARPVVSPVGTGDLTWEDLVRDDPSLAGWCAERWLAAQRRIEPPPATLAATRDGLHRLAVHVIAPTRRRAPGGKTGLRWVRGGFGTPFFGNDVQLRVAGDVLTVQVDGTAQRGRLGSLADAAEFVGFDLTRYDLAEADQPLAIDPVASTWIGELLGFGTSALEQLRAEASPDAEPSRVQLWPEPFALSLELGDERSGRRASFGVSPGDAERPEPFVFVRPWTARPEGERWRADGFDGAQVPLAEILAAADQREALLGVLRDRRDALDAFAPA